MAVSRNEAERDAHIRESVSNLDTVLFSVNADVDQCAVKIFLAELSYSRRKLVHRSRNDVAEVLHHSWIISGGLYQARPCLVRHPPYCSLTEFFKRQIFLKHQTIFDPYRALDTENGNKRRAAMPWRACLLPYARQTRRSYAHHSNPKPPGQSPACGLAPRNARSDGPRPPARVVVARTRTL